MLVLSIAVLVLVIDALCFQVHGTGCPSKKTVVRGVRLHRFVLALLRARAQHRGARNRNRRSVCSGAWHRMPGGNRQLCVTSAGTGAADIFSA